MRSLLITFLFVVSVFGWNTPAATPETRVDSRNKFGYDPREDFIAFDPQYPQKHREAHERLRALQLELARQAGKGRKTVCSRQIFLEARWLTYYSAHWDRINKRLDDLQKMLAAPADPPDSNDQVEADGSYDHCSDAWYLKVDSTIEEIERRGELPKLPLKLLDRINSPEKLTNYLDSVLVSDVRKTGLDNRFELNIATSALIRLIRGDLGNVYPFVPELEQAMLDYMDNKWQDPKTGYYGGWYRMPDGSIRKTSDLSITFHIVSYRRTDTLHYREMMATTMAFKGEEYPFGWLEEGQKSNHHNYDVVRLFRLGWKQMSDEQREQARQDMREMIEFCLNQTMNPDGSFKLMDEDTLGSSFMLPVSLLDEAGFFRKSRCFWTAQPDPRAQEIAQRIDDKIQALGLTDSESVKTHRKLRAIVGEAKARHFTNVLFFTLGVGGGVWFFAKRLKRARGVKPSERSSQSPS